MNWKKLSLILLPGLRNQSRFWDTLPFSSLSSQLSYFGYLSYLHNIIQLHRTQIALVSLNHTSYYYIQLIYDSQALKSDSVTKQFPKLLFKNLLKMTYVLPHPYTEKPLKSPKNPFWLETAYM